MLCCAADLWRGIECRPSGWPVGTYDCGARLSCGGLGWDPEAAGHSDVCGSSLLVGLLGSDDLCVRESTYSDAEGLCEELGSRLCTVAELGRREGMPEACGYDSGTTPSKNQMT